MTSRLKDDTPHADPALQELAKLCRLTGPTHVDATIRARISLGLDARTHVPRSDMRRLAVIATLLVFLTTAALAMVGPLRRAWSPSPQRQAELSTPKVIAPPPVPESLGSEALRAPDGAAAEPAPAPRSHSTLRTAPKPVNRQAADTEEGDDTGSVDDGPTTPSAPSGDPGNELSTPQASPQPSQPIEESLLVHDAARTLRVEHQPRRALVLIESYLQRFPGGVILEEALALAIEASSQLGDSRVGEFATRYLTHFPSGRFAGVARAAMIGKKFER